MAEVSKLGRVGGNRHPVDELAEIRDTIRRLKEREDELRQMIISKKCNWRGDDHTASVKSKNLERLDQAMAVREFGMDRLRKFFKTTEAIYVTVKRNA